MAERQPLKNNGKQKGRRRPVKGLSGTTKRVLALILTVTLFCGAVAVVAYRDRFNLDALKRYMTYRSLEKNDQGQTAEFTYTRDASNAFASLNGSLVLCSDTALQLYSNSGVLYIDRQVKMHQPVISVCGTYAVVYDVEPTCMLSTTRKWSLSTPAGAAVTSSLPASTKTAAWPWWRRRQGIRPACAFTTVSINWCCPRTFPANTLWMRSSPPITASLPPLPSALANSAASSACTMGRKATEWPPPS